MNQYNRIRKIGKGNYGDVWLVEDKDHQQFAMKRIDTLFQTIDPQNEVNVIKVLKHPNIIKYYDSFQHNNKLCIVMEYAENLDLSAHLKNIKLTNVPIPQVLNWFTQLCLAIQYLHSQKIIHRDIKMKNVFLTKDGLIKLGDFSISKKMSNILTNTSLGTPYYLSPEICQSKNYNHKTDIWNLGCFLYELITQQKPFCGDSIPAICHNIIHGDTPQISNELPKSKFWQDIINMCLQKDPELRPDIKNILAIPQIQIEHHLIQQMYKDKGIFYLKLNLEDRGEKIRQLQLTPQYKQQTQFSNIFSECSSPNKKPYKKFMTIDTQLDEKQEYEDITQKKPSFTKLLFNPKTPTSPNRNILMADFLRSKLGDEVFQKIKNLLESSSDPLLLLEQRQQIQDIIGEQNMDCIKIFKLLISNSITPPSSHFRTLSAYQFLNSKNKQMNQTISDIKTNAWDDKF
ncbi:hypothetical protein pb186bvf_013947 [Paramecium bursaria]